MCTLLTLVLNVSAVNIDDPDLRHGRSARRIRACRASIPHADVADRAADFDTALFKSGKLAMWINGIWQLAGLNATDGLDYDLFHNSLEAGC